MATLFDKLYAATEEGMKVIKKPFIHNKVNRAIAGAIDSYESNKIDVQEDIDKLTAKLVNGETDVIGNLIELRLTLAEIDLQSAEIAKVKVELDSEVTA
jgi:FixJ family two-component response regulator